MNIANLKMDKEAWNRGEDALNNWSTEVEEELKIVEKPEIKPPLQSASGIVSSLKIKPVSKSPVVNPLSTEEVTEEMMKKLCQKVKDSQTTDSTLSNWINLYPRSQFVKVFKDNAHNLSQDFINSVVRELRNKASSVVRENNILDAIMVGFLQGGISQQQSSLVKEIRETTLANKQLIADYREELSNLMMSNLNLVEFVTQTQTQMKSLIEDLQKIKNELRIKDVKEEASKALNSGKLVIDKQKTFNPVAMIISVSFKGKDIRVKKLDDKIGVLPNNILEDDRDWANAKVCMKHLADHQFRQLHNKDITSHFSCPM